MQVAENLAAHGPLTLFPHEEMNISGTKIMKGVTQVSVFGKV
jgi:hypothetical protein